MSLENYEGTAIDTSEFIDVQPVAETEVQTEVAETVVPTETEEVATETPAEETPEIASYDVPGVGKLTADEIKELKQGSLRQSDYTKKTQDLARQREELKNADELFQYLRANPQLVEAMKTAEGNPNATLLNTATPDSELLQKLAYNQKSMEVDMQLNTLKSKYGDVDEIALFKKAAELGTDDLEFVYKGLRHDSDGVDKAAIIEQVKAEIKAELEKNKSAVSTIVGTTQTKQVQTATPLDADQKRIAQAMNMTEDEYRKWL